MDSTSNPHGAARSYSQSSDLPNQSDPFARSGRIVEAPRRAGYEAYGSDIVDRGNHLDAMVDFFDCRQSHGNSIVCNPSFHVCRPELIGHALKLANKAAMIWLARRLNAARWLRDTPLARVYFLTPRPSMPPGHVILAGEKPGGGSQDFVWLVWEHGHAGPPELHWLHRDSPGTP